MKTGQAGIDLIKKYEGCRLDAYKCPAGVWTIGYGHTGDVQPGQKITQAQAEAILRVDLEKFEKKVEKYYSRYRWRQNEFDAMVSFAFNLAASTSLLPAEQGAGPPLQKRCCCTIRRPARCFQG